MGQYIHTTEIYQNQAGLRFTTVGNTVDSRLRQLTRAVITNKPAPGC